MRNMSIYKEGDDVVSAAYEGLIYMDIYIARQLIFDSNNKSIGYELLFRNSLENRYTG